MYIFAEDTGSTRFIVKAGRSELDIIGMPMRRLTTEINYRIMS
jgi:hypothetical protein